MKFAVLNNSDVSHMDKIIRPNGDLIAVPASVYKNMPHDDIRLWCHKNAIYGLPTVELISSIRQLLFGEALEIGAGDGVFGRELGIKSTDSYIQNSPEMRLYYAAVGQPIVNYGDNVEQISANDAVLKYKPDVVVASWVTQYVSPDEPIGTAGCAAGVDEIEMLKHIKRYILFGNVKVHQDKKIFKLPNVKVTEIQSPDFVSRAEFQDLNRLWVVDVLQ
jgi:hypothetical protein